MNCYYCVLMVVISHAFRDILCSAKVFQPFGKCLLNVPPCMDDLHDLQGRQSGAAICVNDLWAVGIVMVNYSSHFVMKDNLYQWQICWILWNLFNLDTRSLMWRERPRGWMGRDYCLVELRGFERIVGVKGRGWCAYAAETACSKSCF